MKGWRGTLLELIYASILWLGYMLDNIFTFRVAKGTPKGAGGEHGQHTENIKCKSAELVASPAPTTKGK